MKLLASVTIIMAVPTVIASFFGMNVQSIPAANAPLGFEIIVLVSINICIALILYFRKKGLF